MTKRINRYLRKYAYKFEPCYTMQETCNVLNFDESTVRYHFQKKRLQGYKYKNKYYFTVDSVNTFIKMLAIQKQMTRQK